MHIGLMSGTSLDGIDAVLADFERPNPLVASLFHPFDRALRDALFDLQTDGERELHRAATCANALAQAYAAIVIQLLDEAAVGAEGVRAIGCHGQTVRHQPDHGYSIQLVNGALLAELTGITVATDFRSRDIAAGGQGAPLVPAFHRQFMGAASIHRAVVNIGGIANITDIPTHGPTCGFDCGPGNALLDAWAQRHRGEAFDRAGGWAASGRVIDGLLFRLRSHPYFRLRPPKSTGRETFNLKWVESQLDPGSDPADVQATLLALTASEIAAALASTGASEVYVCGGGAHNTALVDAISRSVSPRPVTTTASLGFDPDWVEALAFAWLAREVLEQRPGNLPEVTGATGPRLLGCIYPA